MNQDQDAQDRNAQDEPRQPLSFWIQGKVPADNTIYRISVGVSIAGEDQEYHAPIEHELVAENIGGRATRLLLPGEILRWWGEDNGAGVSKFTSARDLAEDQYRHYLSASFIVAHDLLRESSGEKKADLAAKLHLFLAAASVLKTYFGKGFVTADTIERMTKGDETFIDEHASGYVVNGLEDLLTW